MTKIQKEMDKCKIYLASLMASVSVNKMYLQDQRAIGFQLQISKTFLNISIKSYPIKFIRSCSPRKLEPACLLQLLSHSPLKISRALPPPPHPQTSVFLSNRC